MATGDCSRVPILKRILEQRLPCRKDEKIEHLFENRERSATPYQRTQDRGL